MKKMLKFGVPQNIKRPGSHPQAAAWRFPFRCVSGDPTGEPEERQHETEHWVEVRISEFRRVTWRISDSDLKKVLFAYAKRAVVERVENEALTTGLQVDVRRETHPDYCPFDPSRIENPEGAIVSVPEATT